MKLKDLDDKDRRKVNSDIEDTADAMGFKDSDWGKNHNSNRKDQESIVSNRLGICGKCDSCCYTIGEYGSIWAKCDYYDLRLSGNERVKDCIRFARRGQMTLQQACSLAVLIDDDGGPRKIGLV